MRTLRGLRATVALGVAGTVGLFGCETELKLDPPASATDAVSAQFDPTNPIPVLRLIPAPTALAEVPGGLNVATQDCEKPSTKQCLDLVTGWPASTKPVLYFSGPLDEATIPDGIKLVRLGAPGTAPTPVSFTAKSGARPAIPAACQTASRNGSNPPRAYTASDIPTGIQVELTPDEPLAGGARYAIVVWSSETGGLKSRAGKRVEPSALFSLLNVPTEASPIVVTDGKAAITSPLLRSQVQSSVLGSAFPGKSVSELSEAELATFGAAVENTARTSLLPLYQYFASVIGLATAAQIAKREDIVFVNLWTTAAGDAGGEIAFDPAKQVIPFPNVELLTATTGPALTDVQVAFPINPCGDPATPGCDSPTGAGLKAGMNTLTGFSTTAPISVSVTAPVDRTTLADNVRLIKLSASGAADGEVAINVVATATAANGLASIVILPRAPLEQNALYAVAVKKGLKDASGAEFRRNSTFNLITSPDPLVTADGVNPDAKVKLNGKEVAVQSALLCSQVSATGKLLTDAQVAGSAAALEFQVKRARWQTALNAFAGATPPIAKDDILIAWSYKTQAITNTLDAVKEQLLPGPYQQLRMAANQPRLAGPLPITAQGLTEVTPATTPNVEQLFQIVEQFCTQLCGAGSTSIPVDQCIVNGAPNPALSAQPLCRVASGLLTGRVGSVRRYALTTYDLTAGNPNAGAGTFSQAKVVQPTLGSTAIWVITPRDAAGAVPVAIFQHGLGRAKEDGFYISNTLAGGNHATVLMDLPYHGSRASDLVRVVNGAAVPCLTAPVPDPDAVTCDAAGVCTGGCDGVRDPSGAGFLSANVFASRDNFRQATVDQLTLLRAIQAEGTTNGLLPFLDGTKVGYAGQSLGGITGANFAAYAPELTGAVLNVAGGGLTNLLLGTVPQIAVPLFVALNAAGVCQYVEDGNPVSGCRRTPAFNQFLILAQTALDPGDPLATSIGILRRHGTSAPLTADKVLLQMATPDLVVPNSTSLALAGALGFNVADSSGTSRFQRFDFGPDRAGDDPGNCHGFILAPLERCGGNDKTGFERVTGGICATLGAQQQAARFIASAGATIGTRNGALPPGLPLSCP